MTIRSKKTPDKEFHDSPPTFKAIDRKRFFYLDEYFKDILATQVRGNANIVFIVVAYGYFKATGQFFETARQDDIDYVSHRLKLNRTYHWDNYQKITRDRHRKLILSSTGFKPFTENSINPLIQIIRTQARSQKNPKNVFVQACQWLYDHKVETPNFDTVSDTIDKVYKLHMDEQLAVTERNLSDKDVVLLDSLFEKTPNKPDGMEVYRVTLFKKFKQSTKVNNIRENVEAYDLLKPLYAISYPIIEELDLSKEGLKRFAHSVNRKQIFQIKRLNENQRYLHLTVFIVHQFNLLVDILLDTFLSAVKSAINSAEVKAKEEYYKQRKEQTSHTQTLVSNSENLLTIVEKLRDVLNNPTLTDAQKVEKSLKLISPRQVELNGISESISDVQNDIERLSGQALFMRFLEEGEKSLHLKCNDIICRIHFVSDDPNSSLIRAIERYQSKGGKVNSSYPVGFLENAEKQYVDDKDGFRNRLYKVLLYKHIADNLKWTSLNVIESIRFKHLDEYLFSKTYYEKNRERLLKIAEMEEFSDVEAVFKDLELRIDAQFQETNEHIQQNINEYVEPDGVGGFKLTSERNTKAEVLVDSNIDIELFPHDKYTSIAEAICTVNTASGFLEEFEHNSTRYLKKRPEDKNFIAGIIALGEHFTVGKLSIAAKDIDLSSLETTTRGFFTLENVRRANDSIIRFVNQLPLAKVFESSYGFQTSSDGQKWPVAYESLNSNHSFKYGGHDPVVAAYTFTDCRGMFPYSDVISGSEREAHYMIDGLLHNDVVKSDMHSTDTHGYTHAVFALTHLLKITFAPRIKNPGKRYLYSFKFPSHYKKKGYVILPKSRINIETIKPYWEEVLRLVVSIKLGEVTASQIFKRINSYAQRKNSLYDAIVNFGGIPKTHYILRYADDIEMRKAVHKQLNKGELGNKLDRALAIGRKEYTQTLKEDQQIAESCKRLIKNVVVCWNIMYLSHKLALCKTDQEKKVLLEKIKTSSMLAWEHFIFSGWFDFSENALKDSQNFDFIRMMDPDLIK